ncbi:hypothetical protein HOD05_03945 [Candidatus Woesearchaeota archaeon]|nr:hypothetical protein [Candidatus Woesearchaeota archaeon]MBT4150348.1 hypothetical protein [Candidatus Woesearchaeota archaeon]MBT4247050.1 hypothetical protein [Candidatus Woesearchaeota archaeon]MBT4434346.1 hypothetical protein [Candidatus Woesearchaeota archaeon]
MTLPAHSLGRRTLDHKLQEHLVVGKRYARLGIFKGVSSSLLDEGKSRFYNFQKAPQEGIFGYRAKQVLRTHHLILYN